MTYCSYEGFKILAANYLEISHDNPFFGEELMKNEDAEAMLEGFVKLLKKKKMECDV